MRRKEYQERVLDMLQDYCKLANSVGTINAFTQLTERQYIGIRQLPGLPYVCLRVPTGGGKTYIASRSISVVRSNYLRKDMSVVLWLVPTNQIKDQTLEALKDIHHPYRLAIENGNGKSIQVWDLHDALYANRSFYEGSTCIIVSTLAALRIDDINGRKIYESNGNLMNHFTGLNIEQLSTLEKGGEGETLFSLANVLKIRRPIIIMDEAHNARTPLSFETLARFSPSAIIEFTATPQQMHNPERGLYASNVLYSVSAAELQAEDMIKMPIYLETNTNWEDIIKKAITKRNGLEKIALKEFSKNQDYIRPILLIQAQSKNQNKETLTVENIKNHLINLKVPEEYIKIQTGEIKELDGEDLFSSQCSVRYIITIQALKEGWDCSFAYVLASVVDTGSATSSEQLVGRILRLPNATRKFYDELNCSYAYVVSDKFHETLASLGNSLIENGYTEFEAKNNIIEGYTQIQPTLFDYVVSVRKNVVSIPNLNTLPEHLNHKVEYNQQTHEIELKGEMTHEDIAEIENCFSATEDRNTIQEMFNEIQLQIGVQHKKEPIIKPTKTDFNIPLLLISRGEQMEIFEDSHFINTKWNILDYPARVDAEKISANQETRWGKIDVNEKGKAEWQFITNLQEQLSFLSDNSEWSIEELIYWLDRNITHLDIAQSKFVRFVNLIVEDLIDNQGLSFNKIVHFRYALRDNISNIIKQCRTLERAKGYQLIMDSADLYVQEECCFTFNKQLYPANSIYSGGYKFQKHYYDNIGELKSTGEEFNCAVFIDSLPEIKYWVRNLERQPRFSFWLQTSTDKFYPDFIAELNDGRILVVEYKGALLKGNPDTNEKDLLGKLWARKSNGKCLYITAYKDSMEDEIKKLISK